VKPPTQLELFPLTQQLAAEELQARMRETLIDILAQKSRPGAGELLGLLEGKHGWQARQLLEPLVRALRTDPTLQIDIRDYLHTVLNDSAIQAALRGETKASQEFKSTLDALFRRSCQFRTSASFREFVEFSARFRVYAPFNNLLVKIQNPSCSFFATERDWQTKFQRQVKEDARAMLILAPMHPVMVVYALDDTDGKPLPSRLLSFAQAEGEWNPRHLSCTLDNAERDQIQVLFKVLSSTRAGFVTTRLRNGSYKMRIVIHAGLDDRSRYTVLCHELAHIYLGHLGGDLDNWWPCRLDLTHASVEIEAEAVSFIVTGRVGLQTHSEEYLSAYLKAPEVPDSVSVELIAKVAGKLEEMGSRRLPPRNVKSGRPQ